MMPSSIVGTCRETAQRISDYLDGRMPLWKRARIRYHLKKCPACKKWVDGLLATLKAVDRVKSTEKAVEIPAEIRQKIEKIFR